MVAPLALFAGMLAFVVGFIPDTPINRFFTYAMNQVLPNKRPSEAIIIEMLTRGIIDEKEARDHLSNLGYGVIDGKDFAGWLIEASKRLLTAEELLIAKWRGIITEDEYYSGMAKLGFDKENASKFEEVRKYYPSPTDFIRFAVREVFNPEIVQEYGLDDEFPENIVPFIEKAGMDEETLKWYWRAHWELPSPTQAYEFLHRLNPEVLSVRGDAYKEIGLDPEKLKFTLDDLRNLLKTADYPPIWRDRLTAISFSPLTRVDLRRIYEMGLITDEEALARLMEYGYTRKDAELLLEWFKLEKVGAERDLTKTEVLNAYLMGLMTQETAKSYLKQLGYSDEEADFLITLYKQKDENKLLDEQINTLKELYANGVINDEELEAGLDSLNLPEAKKRWELLKAQRERLRRIRMPTISEIQRWLRKGIIKREEAEELLISAGVPLEMVEYYIKDALGGGAV